MKHITRLLIAQILAALLAISGRNVLYEGDQTINTALLVQTHAA